MRNKQWVSQLIAGVAGIDRPTADAVVERLMDEGLLHLGYGDADVDKIVETFISTYGTTKTSRQDRWAANRLSQKYGSQAVCGIIQLLGKRSTERYAPLPRNVADLEDKWVSVLNFVRQQPGEEIDA